MLRHLTAAELAGELGRSTDWLYRNWRVLVAMGRIPKPIMGGGDGSELAWSAAQVYALLDAELTPAQRAAAAAYRAAAAAYVSTRLDANAAREIAADTDALDRRFGRGAA